MYMFNPNTTPSPIWDYLIMFTLAKVIYQNVTRNVTGTKTSFISKGKQYLHLILTSYRCKYNYEMIFLQIIRMNKNYIHSIFIMFSWKKNFIEYGIKQTLCVILSCSQLNVSQFCDIKIDSGLNKT